MPPVKPIHQVHHKHVQGQGLRKLKLLLQRWWQKHSHDKGSSRDSYLSCALLFGAAHYLTQLYRVQNRMQDGVQDPGPEVTFVEAIAILQDLWPRALNHTRSALNAFLQSQDKVNGLVADSALRQDFLTLTQHHLLDEIFCSPLCPSFIYEAFSSAERRTSKDLLQDDRSLVDTCHLISFTQVYTPEWVVDHLLQNTLGQILTESLDLSGLSNTTLLDPALGGGVFLVQALASCAAAYQNFGLTAYEATKQSLRNNLFGLDIDSVALTTAALALILKAFSLGLTRGQVEELLPLANLCLIKDESEGAGADEGHNQSESAGESKIDFPLGSLSKHLRKTHGHALNRLYDVVVANPPYLGRKLLPRPLKEKLKRYYPDAASDLSQAFLSMAIDLAKPGGRVGFITQGSFLHLASAKVLREKILKEHQLIQVVELGAGVFPLLAGEKASTALIIIGNSKPASDQRGHFLTLVAESDKCGLLKEALPANSSRTFHEDMHNMAKINKFETIRLQSDFLKDRDSVINYLRPPAIMKLRSRLPKLADIATLKQGLATTNNARFLRYIWEVDQGKIGSRFVPYARGEGGQRWWSPLTTVVLWEGNGLAIKEAVTAAYPYLKGNYGWVVKNEEYYFRSGLTFSFVSKDRLAVRKLAAGAIFDVGSSAIFIDNLVNEGALLAYLNSGLATAMAHDLNPTINFQVGDLKKLVIPDFAPAEQARLSNLAAQCVAAKERLFTLSSPLRFFQPSNNIAKAISITEDSFNQAQSDFSRADEELRACEGEIDALVVLATTRDSGLDETERKAIESFAHRPRQKKDNFLGAAKFCLTGLMEAMLTYFYKTELDQADLDNAGINKTAIDNTAIDNIDFHNSGRQSALIVSLKHEIDADCFISFWPGIVDLSFVRVHLSHDKSLAQYIREDLPQAFDEIFLGQPPLLFIKAEPETIIIVPTLALQQSLQPRTGRTVNECGDLNSHSRGRTLDLLHQTRNIKGLEEMRAKEILRAIGQIKTLVNESTA